MITILLSIALWLLLALPFILLPKKRSERFWEYVLMLTLYFLLCCIVLHLPRYYSELNFIPGSWNWSGKLLAIAGSILFLVLYRGLTTKEVGLTLRQKSVPKLFLVLFLGIIVIGSLWGGISRPAKEWSSEALAFQLLMPTIDEEIAFRGIMLALLNKALCNAKIVKGVSVANLVTSLLFGFVHALWVTNDFAIIFHASYFLQCFIMGIALAYLAERTGSLLFPMLAHSTSNVLLNLIAMVK